jgi:hypothetical protein
MRCGVCSDAAGIIYPTANAGRIDADLGTECSKISFALTPKSKEIEISVPPCTHLIGPAFDGGLARIVNNDKSYQVHPRGVEHTFAGGSSHDSQGNFKRAPADPSPNWRRSRRISGDLDRAHVRPYRHARTCCGTCDGCTIKVLGAHIKVKRDATRLDFHSRPQSAELQGRPRSAMTW